ncbi:IPTL-CTERM sorting domain-containing protein [Acanthopleuribacter pedis]|uniref:IPTL-CTERM sorting domain-containing protein n=1 Tax=Acanthopleuribacter pedis TaxID=442870 RepID=A0A8J7U6P2_9BACT|nr:IPTL-CTERM sorting domain-containing protein [Acanthopleuribacter pedis]MBO1321643.1 IPTL-CTERM sorting domain-containing protein [Acanthopleuribacter pedis]
MRQGRFCIATCLLAFFVSWLGHDLNLWAQTAPVQDEQPLLREYYVNHYKTYRNKPVPGFKLLVRESPVDSWRVLEEPVAGFEFRWGFQYKVRVAIDRPEPQQPFRLRLVEVLSSNRVPKGTPFELSSWAGAHAPLGDQLVMRGKNQFRLLEELDFTADPALSGQLANLHDARADVTLHFRHGEGTMPRVVGLTLNGAFVPTLSAWAMALFAVGLVAAAVIFQTRARRMFHCPP